MRIRLLLDTELDQEQIGMMQELIDKQPPATVQIENYPLLGARLMGAQPVPQAE